MSDAVTREFLLAFWKIHILHHAEEQGVYGHWMLEELHRHGYRLSPGTLYPLLARMARHGWIRATEPKGSRAARVYRITASGSDVLKRLRASLAELQHEVAPSETGRSRRAAVRRRVTPRRGRDAERT
jgi:PadR family transcriptional regulator